MRMKNPWLDINQYTENLHNYYKGRDTECKNFADIIIEDTLSVVYANSGVGKSSFLNAGIIPQLKERGLHISPIQIVFDDEFFNQKEDVEKFVLNKLNKNLQWTSCLKNEVKELKQSLWWRLHAYRPYSDRKKTIPVFIFDQFEEVFVKGDSQLHEKFFSLIEELSFHSLPSIVNQTLTKSYDDTLSELDNSHNYRIIFSLRKEYLADFDHWTNERFSIPQLLRNRMLLLPFTVKQAEEVICKQPLVDESGQIVEGCYLETLSQVRGEIISKLAPYGKGYIEPSLLSVLCYRLFEKCKNNPQKSITLDELKAIDTDKVLRIFYESQLQEVLRSRKKMYVLETSLVNSKGIRNRPQVRELEKKGFDTNTLEELKKRHLIRTEKPLQSRAERQNDNNDSNWVELIHDLIANIADQRNKEFETQKRHAIVKYLLWGVVLVAGIFSLFAGMTTDDKNKVMSNLAFVKDKHFSTDDTLWIDGRQLENNSFVEKLSITDRSEYYISDCSYLSTIDLSNLNSNTFSLTLNNCQALQNIIMPDSIANLSLKIKGCPNLQIHITKGLGILKIDAPTEELSVKVDSDVKDYIWYDKMLWNTDIFELVYFYMPDNLNEISKQFPPMASNVSYYDYKYRDKTIKINNIAAKPDLNNISSVSSGGGNSYIYSLDKRAAREYKSVRFGDAERVIYEKLFYHCNKLESVWLPQNLTLIKASAFEGCTKLGQIHLTENLNCIDERAFYGCKSLKELVIPSHVTIIGEQAFSECDSLKSITFLSSNIKIGKRAFSGCKMLETVNFPEGYKDSTDYLSNPFFDCPHLKNVTNIVITKKQREIERNQEARFYETGQILIESDSVKRLHFPISLERDMWTFVNDPSNLTDIYLPYPQPNIVRHNKISTLSINISDELKGGIVLHVPYGCRRYYESISEFSKYRQIEESSKLYLYFYGFLSVIYSLFQLIAENKIICFLFAIASLLLLYWLFDVRKEKRNYKLLFMWYFVTLATFLLLLLFVCQILRLDGVLAIIISMAATMLLTSYNLMQGHITQKMTRPHFNRPLRRIKGIQFIGLLLLLLFGIYLLFNMKETITIADAVKAGNFNKATQLIYKELMNASSIDKNTILRYREILLQSGITPEVTLVKTIQYDDKTIKPHITDFRNEGPNVLFVQQGDSLDIWSEIGYRRIHKPDNPFKGNSDFFIVPLCSCMNYYNKQSDSTAIFDMNDLNLKPIFVKGTIMNHHSYGSNIQIRSYNFYLTETQDGKRFVYDKNGGRIELPSLPKADSMYSYGNENFHLESVKTSSNTYETIIYGVLNGTAFCRKFSSGEPGRITRNGNLFGESSSRNHAFYNPSKDYQIDSIPVNGTIAEYGDDYIYYTSGGERFLYNILQNYSITLEDRLYNPNATEGRFTGYKYFYLKSIWNVGKAFKYPQIYLFRLSDDYKMVKRLNANAVVECPNNYIAALQDSVRHYYYVDGDFIIEGGVSPLSFHDPMSYNSKDRIDNIQGDFAISYKREKDEGIYTLYPLMDKDVSPLVFKEWQPIISGHNIIQWDWVKGVIIFSRYDTLQDLLEKSPYLSDKEKVLLKLHLEELDVE